MVSGVQSTQGLLKSDARSADDIDMVVLHRARRLIGLVLAALVLAAGCVTQEPPTNSFVNDVQNDFDTNNYFDP